MRFAHRLALGALLISTMFTSCAKDDSGTPTPPPTPVPTPLKSKLTMSFASTANQKKLSLGLTIADTLPATVKVFELQADGTTSTTEAATGTVDKKGDVTVSLSGGRKYVVQGYDAAGTATEHTDTFDVVKVDRLPAAKKTEARAVRIEKAAKKIAMVKSAVVKAAVVNAAKPVAKRKTTAEIAATVNPKTIAKAADKLVKQEKKDEAKAKKNSTTVDTAAAKKKQETAAKAAAVASEKSDVKKKAVAKKQVEKKKAKLGLIAEEATDEEIDTAQEEAEALVDDCMGDTKNVAKFNTEDGVNETALADKCRDDLVKAYPDSTDLMKEATAEEDINAATKEVVAEGGDDVPSAEDIIELRASGLASRAEEIGLTSSAWENLTATQKAAFTSMVDIGFANLDADTLDKVATAIAGTITEADSNTYPIIAPLYALQQGATAAQIAAFVTIITGGFTGDDASEFSEDKSADLSDFEAETEAGNTEVSDGESGEAESETTTTTTTGGDDGDTTTTTTTTTGGDTGGDE